MKKGWLGIVVVLAILLGFQPSSHAIAILTLSQDGVNPDVTGIDSDADGVVHYDGAFGNWSVNFTTGLTKPAIGSATSPELDLVSVNVSSSNGGTLWIMFSDSGFLSDGGASFSVGGTRSDGSTVQFWSYYDQGNDTLELTTPIAALGPFGPGPSAFSGTVFGNVADLDNNYSMTIVAQITHTGPAISSFDAYLAVPEPGIMLLLGCGLIGLWGFRKRIKK